MKLSSLSVGQKLLALFSALALVSIVSGVLSATLTMSVGSQGLRSAERSAPLGDAAMEVKLTATTAHLLFEEIMGGDGTEDMQQVWDLFAETEFYVNAILEGGTNDEGRFYPTDIPAARAYMEETKTNLATLVRLARERYDNRENDTVGSAEESAFDAAFDTVIESADKAETEFHRNMQQDIEGMNAGQQNAVVIVGIASALSLALAIGAYLFSRKYISGRLSDLASATENLAQGNTGTQLPQWRSGDELGTMLASLNTFKVALSERVTLQTESEQSARKTAQRADAAHKLNLSIGEVVDATINGDFSKRVAVDSTDEDLNTLAKSVNTLVETVARGISETGEMLGALAEGDLTRRIESDYRGAWHDLTSDANHVADRLNTIMEQLRTTSRGVKSATGEILAGANDLSERTTKQAATIEETSAAIEQLSSTVADNAKKAEAASQQTESAARLAEEGGTVMNEATLAMEKITQSSSKISNIIGMIDDIAFQTNLLALNASVEAARAGEAGKGFAVVAIEVRRLAQSAAEASSEVKQLIERSAEEVSGGSKLVADAAEKLASMLEAVQKNAGMMRDIFTASREQAASIDEVNTAVRQLDEMTQHNAALVEETNAAIEQTEVQASELDRIIEVFRLREGSSKPSAAPKPSTQTGAKGLQQKVASAAKRFLTSGNAAVKEDWSEF